MGIGDSMIEGRKLFVKKSILYLLTLVFLIAMFAGCGTKTEEVVVVGMELAYPPFETKDEKGNAVGVSVDLAEELGKYLNKSVRIENISWDGLVPALQTGQVDLVISSMTIKEERLEKIDFSKPYAKALLALLVNTNSGVDTIDDLNQAGKKVAVKLGSTGHIYAEKNLVNAELIVLADESACITEVVQGKADGFIYDQLTIYRNNKANPEVTKAIYIPFQDLEYWGVGVKKGNTALLDQINRFIDKIYAEGGLDIITEKYLADEKASFDEFGFEWFFTNVNE